ncbi:sugar ABC transporter permease [Kineosporia succinea]|uniref:Sorbitol/mannitol transport system permease protein n=1 Tax=Kineosporia succinea TaxID=84632 RepID=A0ABT9P063_9ACTN|nr:sugar ABC transporter permease [Kineosporia succinea]MDP9825615.1 sorbitol/mannitol transport system permease protein [Kineosporia succinea]
MATVATTHQDEDAAPPVRRPTGPSSRTRWKRRAPLLPALVFTIVVTQIPFLVTLALSSVSWSALRPGDHSFLGLGNYNDFVGFDNYATVFTDPRLRSAVVNTITLTVSVVLISLLLGLALAVLLDRKFPGRGLARTLLIAPFLVMPVASALLWKHALYNPTYGLFNGVINGIWKLFGADHGPTVDFVSSYPMPAVVAALVWQWTPFMMLILLAGLQAQPTDILEAARVDGANGPKIFRHITLPHLRQYIELSTLLGAIYIVQAFDAIFSITQGGPGSATTNLPYEIYLTTFRKFEYGEAAAAGVITVIGTIIVATFALRVVSSLFRQEQAR